MSEPILKIADEGRVRILTLNRPVQLNAMNDALYDACAVALMDAADDAKVAVVILTGEGRAFCAGQDLAEMPTGRSIPRASGTASSPSWRPWKASPSR